MYGFIIKYKVMGLGHRCIYNTNIYLLKLGYSHLVYQFIPFEISTKKKKKKKQYHRITSINFMLLSTFFHKLQLMRIPDVYNLNGIFNNYDDIEKKEGKKSFLL
jgi:ribosomal protein L6P/L9E